MLDESDDDDIQVIEHPEPGQGGRNDAAKKEEDIDDDDVGPRPGPGVKGEEDAVAEVEVSSLCLRLPLQILRL